MLIGKNLHKSYGKTPVLQGIDITLERGKIYSLLGVSGTGKTTLLYLLGLIEEPDTGEILFDNDNLLQLKENQKAVFRNKHLGFVFQFHYLLPELDVLDNVCLPSYISGTNKKEKAKQILAELGLQDKINRRPGELSGGEQQRVAVARALINDPSIILADEPTGNLDKKNAMNLFEIFREQVAKRNIGVLIATHDEELAENCDVILRIKDGKLITVKNS